MDLKKYDELRKKINTKDFEGNNKGLDKWLYLFSFVGNASAIFFAYFLVYPALLKTIALNFITGFWSTAIAFIFSLVFLTIFEVTKRYLIRNFSSDFMVNKKKMSVSIVRWFTFSFIIVALSFYLSIAGSKNLATTSTIKNVVAETQLGTLTDSLSLVYEKNKKIYVDDNEALRLVNNDLRKKLAETPVGYRTIRNDYQISIDKNIEIITNNQNEINNIDTKLNVKLNKLDTNLFQTKSGNQSEDKKNVLLFIIIVVFNELIIIGGIGFREYYEYTLFEINHQKFDKIYERKNRYRALIAFVYNEGKLTTGDKVISGLELKELVAEKTNIQNRFIDEFFRDMDRFGVFSTTGKRRYISVSYQEAINIVENYDDALRILENIK